MGPARSLTFSAAGEAGRSRERRGARCSDVYSSSYSYGFPVGRSGVMPFQSWPWLLASSSLWLPFAPSARGPWGTAAGGSGSGDSLKNKLAGQPDLVMLEVISFCFSYCRGGGGGVDGEVAAGLSCSIVASEMGFRRWIRSNLSCSVWCYFSVMRCSLAYAPSGTCCWRWATG